MASEKIYECEVRRRRRVPEKIAYEWFWKVRTVQDAVDDADQDLRCKDCHGAVKLYRRRAPNGPTSHVVHVYKTDSEYCSGGLYYLNATDGRSARESEDPVR